MFCKCWIFSYNKRFSRPVSLEIKSFDKFYLLLLKSVYRIPCGSVYVGEIGRSVKIRYYHSHKIRELKYLKIPTTLTATTSFYKIWLPSLKQSLTHTISHYLLVRNQSYPMKNVVSGVVYSLNYRNMSALLKKRLLIREKRCEYPISISRYCVIWFCVLVVKNLQIIK